MHPLMQRKTGYATRGDSRFSPLRSLFLADAPMPERAQAVACGIAPRLARLYEDAGGKYSRDNKRAVP